LPTGAWTQFETGVRYVLGSWTLLELAVSNGWGGKDTRRKAADLELELLEMCQRSTPYKDELESFLDEFVQEELNCVAEDGSIGQVSETIAVLYAECKGGDFARVEKLSKQCEAKQRVYPAQATATTTTTATEEVTETERQASDDDKDSDAPQPPQATEQEDEGWQVVSNKRKKGGRKGRR